MFVTKVKRVVTSGFISFWRNGFVSLASLLVMVITLLIIGMLIFSGAILSLSLQQLSNKVDINVYFTTNAQETDVLVLKKAVESLPQVLNVTYVSRDQALAEFRDRHKDDTDTINALNELGANPLGAVLNVKAKDPSQYEGIAAYLANKDALPEGTAAIIDKVNYNQNKQAIETLNKIILGANRLGVAIIIIFAVISILITFNTIRLAIYTAREEIAVMRLVGASSMYIRGPFLVTGVLYGLIAAVFTLLVLYPITLWVSPHTANFFGGINIAQYYLSNFIQIFGIILGAGILLGVVSSYLAVKRYLTI
jgi:cell division transport system permease protein